MLSRVADSVFWMARYIERAENAARFIDVNHNLTLDLGEELGDQWAPLLYTTGDHESFFSRYSQATRDNVLHFIAFDKENPNSILSCVCSARENARTAREIISSDMWEEMYRRTHGRIAPQKVIDFLLLDRAFPRSVRYCVGGAEDSLHAVTGTPEGTFGNRAEQELGRLRSELDFTSIDDIIATGLHQFI